MAKNSDDSSEHLHADDETWAAILESDLREDFAAVEALARLLFGIKKEIDGGHEGAARASKMLQHAIELICLYTNTHKAALELYLLSLEGTLKPQDEPLNLINAALARGRRQAH